MSLATWIKNYFYLGEPIDPEWANQSYLGLYTSSDLVTVLSLISSDQKNVLLSNISGNMVIEFEMKILDLLPSGNDPKLQLIQNSSVLIEVWWANGALNVGRSGNSTLVTNTFFDWAPLKSIKFKIERINDSFKVYYYNSGWIDTGHSEINSGDVHIISINGDPAAHGYTYFDFEANGGLPYSASASASMSSSYSESASPSPPFGFGVINIEIKNAMIYCKSAHIDFSPPDSDITLVGMGLTIKTPGVFRTYSDPLDTVSRLDDSVVKASQLSDV